MSSGVARAQPASISPDGWEFALTPFLWGAGIDGTIGLAGRDADFEVSAQDLLKSLDFGITGNFEARRDRWSFAIDAVYVDLGKDVTVARASAPTIAQNLKLDMSMTIVEGNVGYQIADSFDFLAGVRGVSNASSLAVDAGTLADADGGFVDPIVGARFRRYLSTNSGSTFAGTSAGSGPALTSAGF